MFPGNLPVQLDTGKYFRGVFTRGWTRKNTLEQFPGGARSAETLPHSFRRPKLSPKHSPGHFWARVGGYAFDDAGGPSATRRRPEGCG